MSLRIRKYLHYIFIRTLYKNIEISHLKNRGRTTQITAHHYRLINSICYRRGSIQAEISEKKRIKLISFFENRSRILCGLNEIKNKFLAILAKIFFRFRLFDSWENDIILRSIWQKKPDIFFGAEGFLTLTSAPSGERTADQKAVRPRSIDFFGRVSIMNIV